MATGDIVFFDEALDDAFFGAWGTADDQKCALITNSPLPAAGSTGPALTTGTTVFTEVTPGGNYSAGGTSIGAWDTLSIESAGTLTFDSGTNPTWAQNASNPTNAYYGLLYNDTQTGDPAWAFVDLGGPIDMTAGSLTITWGGSGIFTITKA